MDGQTHTAPDPTIRGVAIMVAALFAETLMPLILDLEAAAKRRKQTPLSRLSWSICRRIMSVGPAVFRRAAH